MGGRGGREGKLCFIDGQGDWAWNNYFCFHFVYVVFYCQRGEWARDNYFSFMGGGMRGKETERLFFVSCCPLTLLNIVLFFLLPFHSVCCVT